MLQVLHWTDLNCVEAKWGLSLDGEMHRDADTWALANRYIHIIHTYELNNGSKGNKHGASRKCHHICMTDETLPRDDSQPRNTHKIRGCSLHKIINQDSQPLRGKHPLAERRTVTVGANSGLGEQG